MGDTFRISKVLLFEAPIFYKWGRFTSEIERGIKDPSIETLSKICSALGISLAEFFSNEVPELSPEIRQIVEKVKKLSPRQLKILDCVLDEWKIEEYGQSELSKKNPSVEVIDTNKNNNKANSNPFRQLRNLEEPSYEKIKELDQIAPKPRTIRQYVPIETSPEKLKELEQNAPKPRTIRQFDYSNEELTTPEYDIDLNNIVLVAEAEGREEMRPLSPELQSIVKDAIKVSRHKRKKETKGSKLPGGE